MDAALSSPFPAVSERIAAVIFGLCQTLTTRVRGATATVTQAQLTYIVGRLLGMRKRFNRLVERIRAGQPPRERARKPRAKNPPPDPAFPLGFRPPPKGWRRWAARPDKPVPLWRALRQHRFGWLLPLAPNVMGFRDSAAGHRTQVLLFLEAPETRALLLVSRRVGDTLRPLCWMMGIETSILYPARPAEGAAFVSISDAMVPSSMSADAAAGPGVDNQMAHGTEIPVVVPSGLIAPGAIEPPADPPRARAGDFFKTA